MALKHIRAVPLLFIFCPYCLKTIHNNKGYLVAKSHAIFLVYKELA